MFPLASANTTGVPKPRSTQVGAFDAPPLLQIGAERLLGSLVKSLGTMAGTATTVEGALVASRTVALRDHLAAHRPGAVAAAIDCAGIGCTILVTLDPVLVHAVVELLCGGDGSECRPDETRSATSIDGQYAQIVATLTAGAIAGEWADRGFTGAKAIKIEGLPAPDVCGATTREIGLVTLALAIFGLRGLLTLALPAPAMAAFAGEAERPDEPVPLDPAWSAILRREIGRAAVDVGVMLDAVPLSLRQLSELKPGQMLMLSPGAAKRAALVCDGRTLYRGEIGQDDERYSLRIDDLAPSRSAGAAMSTVMAKSPLSDQIEA